MATRKEETGVPRAGRKTLSGGHGCKVCIECGKSYTPNKEKDGKHRLSKDEPDRFSDEEGSFICEKHRDQLCNDCFHTAVANENERRAFRRNLDRVAKGIWKKIYLNEGSEVPWSEDEDEDNEAPWDHVQRQTGTNHASSSSLLGEKSCAHCGKVGDLDRCAKCKVTFYCSRSHQAADHAKHKLNCQVPMAVVNDTAQPANGEKPCNAADSDGQPSSSIAKACAYCGARDNLSKCARCKCTWYCSVEHQRAHYHEHKQECRMIADMAEIAAQSPPVPIDPFHVSKGLFPFNMLFGNPPTPVESKEIMPEESRVISWKNLR